MNLNTRSFFLLTACSCLVISSGCAETTNSTAAQPATKGNSEAVEALITKVKNSMRFVKGGTFEMGDWGGPSGLPYDMNKDSKPVHKVTLDSFSMMAYKVTYEDFDVFTDATSNERVDMNEISIKYRAPKRPAGVSWYGAKAYCEWLGKLTGLPIDLPTEAQWEYAARSGGKKFLYATDNGSIDRGRNYPPKWKYGEPEPPIPDVGGYPSNQLGLYGMVGESTEAAEWVNDWYDEDYYQHSPEKNPQGPATGTKKVKRGNFGAPAEFAAMTFMRGKAEPKAMELRFSDTENKLVKVPFPGFSNYRSYNFRCAVNSSAPIH